MGLARVVTLAALLAVLEAVTPAAAFRYVSPGDAAPVLTLREDDGRSVNLPVTDRVTVLLFWRPGQRLSEEALNDLGTLKRSLAARRVEFVVVTDADSDEAEARARIRAFGLRPAADQGARAAEAWGVIVYPSTAVIGVDGRLRYYLPSRTGGYRPLVESHVLRALGEISAQELVAWAAGVGDTAGTVAEQARTAHARGAALAREGQWAEAVAAFTEALALAPDLADARVQLGYARLELGDAAGALREFETALARSSASPATRVGLGIARLRLGRTDEGIRLLEEAVMLNPEPVRAHWELARAYEARGDGTRALEHYRWAYLKLRQGRK